MKNIFFRLGNVATIVACLTVFLMFVGCDEEEDNPQEFTVTFNSGGGSDIASQTVKEGGKATKPNDPTRDGFTFDAWYKEAALTGVWDFDTDVVTADVTLHAKWTENSFIVSFNSGEGSEVSSQVVKEGEKAVKPNDPTRDGFTFEAWYKEASLTNVWDFDTDVVTADVTLHAKWNEDETHSGALEMVSVQGGTFAMGESGNNGQVTLSSYSIGKYQVTQEQWLAVMGSWPGTSPSSSYGLGDNYPAYWVSWNDIVGTSSSAAGYTVNGITYYENGFCYKYSQLSGDGKQYRLPTEAEWEFAARGGNQTNNYIYSGSNNIDDVAWYGGNNTPDGSKPVGTKAPNELGIYDMSGNVYEWCGDWLGTYTPDAKTNPIGPTSGSLRVDRGGCWFINVERCRVAHRDSFYPVLRIYNLGFRLACSSE